MVRIRLARAGAKHQPFYRIVVTSRQSGRDGGFVDRIGFHNPVAVGGEVPLRIDTERLDYWTARGAKMSERVKNLVKFHAKHGEGSAAPRRAPPVSAAPDAAAASPSTTGQGQDASA